MAGMSKRAMILQAYQKVHDAMRLDFENMGSGGRYTQAQKEYAFKLIDEYGVRATARILHLPRRTLQRWCRQKGKRIKRCPDWVLTWAAKRKRRRRFSNRHG